MRVDKSIAQKRSRSSFPRSRVREREGALALESFQSEERRSSHRPKDNKHSGNPAEPGSHEREAMAPSTTLHRGRCHPSQITSTCTCWMPIERGGGAGRGEARQGGKGREAKEWARERGGRVLWGGGGGKGEDLRVPRRARHGDLHHRGGPDRGPSRGAREQTLLLVGVPPVE